MAISIAYNLIINIFACTERNKENRETAHLLCFTVGPEIMFLCSTLYYVAVTRRDKKNALPQTWSYLNHDYVENHLCEQCWNLSFSFVRVIAVFVQNLKIIAAWSATLCRQWSLPCRDGLVVPLAVGGGSACAQGNWFHSCLSEIFFFFQSWCSMTAQRDSSELVSRVCRALLINPHEPELSNL